jgi:glycine cleavage system aminomethyltransferase T
MQLEALSVASYGHYYQIAYPNNELTSPRGQRRSALYDVVKARGSVNGTTFGWERANWFARAGLEVHETPTFERSSAWPHVQAEHLAVRAGVGVVDQSSFAKYEISGRGALPLLQQVAGADLDVVTGKIVHTQLLNARGGIEAGWELHVPTEYLRDLYERVLDAGEQFDLRDAGYRALNSLRLEKQYLAWAVDIKTDNDPFEAGLAFAVCPDKPELLAGPALRSVRDPVRRRLSWFSVDPEVTMPGGELLTRPRSELATTVRSAGYGCTVERTIFSAYVPIELCGDREFLVDVAGDAHPAIRPDQPLYDPEGSKIRS